MNCDDFNDKLPEYLDGTLTASEQATASEHARECAACQKTLARQESLAKAIRVSLQCETGKLSLGAEARRKILAATTRKPEPAVWESFRAWFAATRRRMVLAGIAGLCFLLLISGGYLYLHSKNNSGREIATNDDRYTYVVDVPVRAEMYVFRTQGDTVVDAVITETGVADASFAENIRPPALPKFQPNPSNL